MGFTPNDMPSATADWQLAMVDINSDLIVAPDNFAMTDEDEHLVAVIEEVRTPFVLETPPKEILGDRANPSHPPSQISHGRPEDTYPISLK